MKKTFDMLNLLSTFDESLAILVRHIEQGYPDRAALRAKEMQKVIDRLKSYCMECKEKRLIDEI